MGITYVKATLTGPRSARQEVRFLVDSGASYSVLPNEVWKKLKLKPKRTVSFSLADGTAIEREVSECHFTFGQEEGHSPVVLGEPGDVALLGAITLENLGLVLDPFKRRLQPMRMLLA